MMKFLFSSLLFILLSSAASAQVSLGLRASYGSSDLQMDSESDALSDQFDDASSLSFGLIVECRFSEVFSLRSGAELNRRGTTFRGGQRTQLFGVLVPLGTEAKTRFTYIDIPLMVQLSLPTESVVQPYVFLGPTFGLATQGNMRTTTTGQASANLMTSDIDLDDVDYKRSHVAAKIGLGLRFNLDEGFAAFVEGRYEQSLNEPYVVPVLDLKAGYRGTQFGAGFMFRL